MEYSWIAIAFIGGLAVKQIGLPPLVGYLIAGFVMHGLQMPSSNILEPLAELGVSLLLFTIGLKLNFKSLFKTEIWLSASAHMLTMTLLSSVGCLVFAFLGLSYFAGMNLGDAALIGFAISFSSTICAVKILEEKGDMKTRHGQISIGILVIQDIAAAVFITFTADHPPSWWALLLLLLPLLRPVMDKILQICGHGEILPLAGLFFALGGGELFAAVGLKEHLGALVTGILLSQHPKTSELAKSLLGLKDLLLIGFFFSIGFTALPTWDMVGAAMIITLALPFKAALFLLWLTRLKLRGRTAFLTALSLSNFSEFGLIVCAASTAQGWLSKEWLVIIALAVSFSFVLSSLLNARVHQLYAGWKHWIKKIERSERLPEDEFIQPHGAEILIMGMGRVGTGAYDSLSDPVGNHVWGVDADTSKANKHKEAGRQVISGDAEDADFWENIKLDNVRLIMLAMPAAIDNLEAVRQLQLTQYKGKIAGIARFEDERQALLSAGVDVVFNYYAEAGAGFANETAHLWETKLVNKG